jgi:hypothetical protein
MIEKEGSFIAFHIRTLLENELTHFRVMSNMVHNTQMSHTSRIKQPCQEMPGSRELNLPHHNTEEAGYYLTYGNL